MDGKDEVMKHLDHVQYPATKQQLVEACNNMDHVSEEDKKWLTENLPARTFNSAQEVKEDLEKMM